MNFQVIDELQEYKDCADIIKQWKLQQAGFDYHVVAVFGSQSSGKSTLLNHLFNTSFDVMDAQGGRGQTTRGIWMSREESRNIIVLDVEGTDGRERGEDQDFERKSALFSLATAELLIINMFEQTVGLYNGANMSLLRTVLEVNLQLFQNLGVMKSKTCLMFVFRDSSGQTPLENLAATVKSDLETIWTSLSKPAGKESVKIEDYFDFSFHSVAHKIFLPDKFNSDLSELRARFLDKGDEGFLNAKYHKGIPIDGFSVFAKNIWEKITANRDLDLPTQQQLLAQYRCDEISKSAFDIFVKLIEPVKPQLEKGTVIKGFANLGEGFVREVLDLFDQEASRYHSGTYKEKRLEFQEKVYASLHILYLLQLRNLHKITLSSFSSKMKEMANDTKSGFSNHLNSVKEGVLLSYQEGLKDSLVSGSEWKDEVYIFEINQDIEKLCAVLRSEELRKVNNVLEKSLPLQIADPVALLLIDCKDTIWTDILNSFELSSKALSAKLNLQLKEIGVTEEEVTEGIVKLKLQCWQLLISILKSEFSDSKLLEKLRKKFEKHFRYTDKGLPRVWKPEDDIDSIFAIAKTNGDKLLSLFSACPFAEDSFDQELVKSEEFELQDLNFISPSRLASLKEIFSREAESSFLDAKRSTIASTAQIPYWFLLLTVALGWNELVTVLRNPMLTISFIILGIATYVVFYTNLGGPIIQIVTVTTKEVANQAKKQLKERGLDTNAIVSKVKEALQPNPAERFKSD